MDAPEASIMAEGAGGTPIFGVLDMSCSVAKVVRMIVPNLSMEITSGG